MTDINFVKEILKNILEGPSVDESRCLPLSYIPAEWISKHVTTHRYN